MAARSGSEVGQGSARPDPGEFRDLLDAALRAADADEKVGPMLRATGLRLRFEFPDLPLVLNVSAAEDGARHLIWSFGEAEPDGPRLELEMESDVANRYLQGAESLPIAIARGKVRCRGSSKMAIFFLPALRLIVEPYRHLVRRQYPHLALR